MILHYYFARRFLWTFLSVLAIFGLFQFLLDLIEELRAAEPDMVFGQVAQLTALKLPAGLYQIMPLVMILATIALFLALARSSELVVARASGRSGLVVLAAPVLVATVIGGLTVAMMNPIVAATSQRYTDLREEVRSGEMPTLSIGAEGLWLRQGGDEGRAVIRAARANAEATVLYDVDIVTYLPGGGPDRRIVAREAALEPGAWRLSDATVWPLTPGLNPQLGARDHATLTLPSSLTQENIRDRFGRPEDVSIWDLPAFISDLQVAGFSARRHLVWLQMELARPIFLVAMVLIGAAFTMRPARGARTGLAVLSAVLLGFGLYYVRNFAQIMGENGQLSPALAAWVPPVASLLLALGLVLQREDG
ncbi:LPS export ABC transporter permease LptG [Citreimonas sp.]|uniref:LPS export ABC transporter permease LptG n=1 Tax=Citreimonas sp. TaxID=3036715 RepID=UPI0035C7D49F